MISPIVNKKFMMNYSRLPNAQWLKMFYKLFFNKNVCVSVVANMRTNIGFTAYDEAKPNL